MAKKRQPLKTQTWTPPYYPIIFVRGYAMTEDDMEKTVETPYMGFNLGSTRLRQMPNGTVVRHYFESPLIRLMKDYGYRDVYTSGEMLSPDAPLPYRSVVIYRYYDKGELASLLGGEAAQLEIEPERASMEDYALGLAGLILRIRNRMCGPSKKDRKQFRVYLVGHSMGGLIIRCFLQNQKLRQRYISDGTVKEALKAVDKVFTYATPHNGIDLKWIGNVPEFLSSNNLDHFNRQTMAKYLGLTDSQRVDNLNGAFDANRFFCLVGTDNRDYAVAKGLSRYFAGPMSDGLVRISNATVFDRRSPTGPTVSAPRAFVHRSHSGPFGIVNSEEGYQNLRRFLFGDVRVDGILAVRELSLPHSVEKAKQAGRKIRASYHFEVVVSVRGCRWNLHRRVCEEESAVLRRFDEMFPKTGRRRNPHLFSAYLSSDQRVDQERASLGFAVALKVRVPDYYIDGSFWNREHHEGSTLFDQTIFLEATPPGKKSSEWLVRYRISDGSRMRGPWDASPSKIKKLEAERMASKGNDKAIVYRIPLMSRSKPGMKATLRLICRPWNQQT